MRSEFLSYVLYSMCAYKQAFDETTCEPFSQCWKTSPKRYLISFLTVQCANSRPSVPTGFSYGSAAFRMRQLCNFCARALLIDVRLVPSFVWAVAATGEVGGEAFNAARSFPSAHSLATFLFSPRSAAANEDENAERESGCFC